MRKIFISIIVLFMIAAPTASAAASARRVVTDPYSLIAAVNALRAANGLPAYTVSPILMGTAQQHAEFMSVNGVSHTGYGGTRPYQRALNAGYPLAGDLSLGGFMSENITAGGNKSVQDAVTEWMGDAPHQHTMLSSDLQEIGAGVAKIGEYVYYVIDCARPTGGGKPQNTPAPGQTQAQSPTKVIVVGPPLARTVYPNTPNPDGKLYHVVGPGETLWLIAISYKVKIADIRALNYMSESEAIYPGQKLLISKDGATAAPPTETPAIEASSLAMSSSTPEERATLTRVFMPTQETDEVESPTQIDESTPVLPPSPSPTPLTPMPLTTSDSNVVVLGIIVLAALVLAGVLARVGGQPS